MSWSGLMRSLRITALLLLIAGTARLTMAQNITGEIDGTVHDSLGNVVDGASITVTNTDTQQVVRNLKTGKAGEFSATLLQVGHYTIVIEAPTFQTEQITDIEVNVGDTLRKDVALKPGSTSTEVTVNASGDDMKPNLETQENSSIIGSTEIKELALNTRNFEQMIMLQPGVSSGQADELYTGMVDPTGGNNLHQLSINGLQPTQVSFLLDGGDILNHTTAGNTIVFPNVNAIAQIQTMRNNFGAQYSGGGSAQVSVVTKAGGAQFHGDVFMEYRNSDMAAYDFLAVVDGTPKQSDTYYDGGFTIGGPIFFPKVFPRSQSKSYFFFAQEVRDIVVTNGTVIGNVPDPYNVGLDPTNGYAPIGGASPTGGWFQKPVCLAYESGDVGDDCPNQDLAIYNPAQSPDPTGHPFQVPYNDFTNISKVYIQQILGPGLSAVPQGGGGAGNGFLKSSHQRNYQELLRLDRQFGERLNGFFRWLYDPNMQELPNGYNTGGNGYPGVADSRIFSYGESFLAHGTWQSGPNTVVEVGADYEPYEVRNVPIGLIMKVNSPGVQFNLLDNSNPRQPSVGFLGSTLTSSGPGHDTDKTLQIFENTTHVIGKHVLYIGGNYEHYTERVNEGTTNAGAFAFQESTTSRKLIQPPGVTTPTTYSVGQLEGAVGDFLIGYPQTFTQTYDPVAVANGVSGDPIANPISNEYEAYIQDNWRATATLTIDAGVRYSVNQAPKDGLGHLGAFQPESYNPQLAPVMGINGTICNQGASTSAACSSLSPSYNPYANSLNGVTQANTSNTPYGAAVSSTPLLDFAPRVGFAWNVYGDGNTSIRGGYGIYFNQIPLFTYATDTFNNPGYASTPVLDWPLNTFWNGAGAGGSVSTATKAIYGITQHFVQPYTQAFSLGLQQQLPMHMMLDMSYAGNTTQHLQGEEDLNQPQPGVYYASNITSDTYYKQYFPTTTLCASATNPANVQTPIPGSVNQNCYPTGGGVISGVLNRIRPYLGYGPINYISTRYFSNYNALQMTLQWKPNKGSTVSVNYTFSKAMSNSPGPSPFGVQYDPQNRYNLKAEWGPTVLNRKNIFVAHYVYKFPTHSAFHGFVGGLINGWEMSGVVTLRTGASMTANDISWDPAGQAGRSTGSNAQLRPDMVGDPNHGLRQPENFFGAPSKPGLVFNYPQLSVNSQGILVATPVDPNGVAVGPSRTDLAGNEHIGCIIGPGYMNIDADVFKNFELRGNQRLQLRAEVFNLFNHINTNKLGLALNTQSTFGEGTSFYENRAIQVGGKWTF